MLKITFRYIDKYSNGEWKKQTCIVNSIRACKEIYGLGTDPDLYDYQIITVENIQKGVKYVHRI